MRSVALPDGTKVPALGQGTWKLGEGERPARQEAAALRLGIELGLTLIDTAEMYGDGASEEVVAAAIAGLRDRVYLVTKAYPQNASRTGLPAACIRSLRRLKTDVIDLYLLHWRGGVPLAETVAAFEKLKAEGKIRQWGVSNLDQDDMEELLAVPGGGACTTNQVLYNPEYRGIEFDLLPWSETRLPLMAYSPVGQGGRLLRSPALRAVATRHGVTPAQVAIAWSLRHPGVISIPKSGSIDHVRENAAAAGLKLTPEDLAEIDRAYPPPRRKVALAML
ncbi:methylglyoxal reductase YeaE [Rhodovastum atsumiense]|uniref:Aldo/keto reductase n=1 Tax=Rhodovastum atsumiense TaxID=504468 RepID=A0A5M6J009_9PROT|nr:aldo/keto reductase [Rhodovastum atsumiense]KAA5612928.1 aldo/keto reductase [Rhodovastum atsumiense]CAH2600987.1 methylglyoxal reductase YeaE [Rhodovastum atsumiense]